MKAIILAAGYAVRLYPLTENKPKPLLEVKGKPIMTHILQKIEELPVSEVLVVSNDKFHDQFVEWQKNLESKLPVKIVNDGSKSNDDRLGAIGDIKFVLDQEKLEEDFLVVSGDNLFNFSLKKMHEQFAEKKKIIIGAYDVGFLNEAKKFGILELDKESKVVGFEEKPESPVSTLASIGVYFFTKETVSLIQKYLDEGHRADAPGYFISWLYKNAEVLGWVFHKKWFDIGSFESLERAQKEFKEREEEGDKAEEEEEEEEEGFFGFKKD